MPLVKGIGLVINIQLSRKFMAPACLVHLRSIGSFDCFPSSSGLDVMHVIIASDSRSQRVVLEGP